MQKRLTKIPKIVGSIPIRGNDILKIFYLPREYLVAQISAAQKAAFRIRKIRTEWSVMTLESLCLSAKKSESKKYILKNKSITQSYIHVIISDSLYLPRLMRDIYQDKKDMPFFIPYRFMFLHDLTYKYLNI